MPQIFVLDSAYKPGNTIKTFESLVWTERYRDAGDFKLVVENEVTILNQLPIIVSQLPVGTLISHTDTKEVMIVENHEVERDSNRKLKITITGRSLETFSENRLTLGSNLPLKEPDPADATQLIDIVYTSASMSSPQLVTSLLQNGMQPGVASAVDAIPNLVISMDMRVLDSPMAHVVERGDIYSLILRYLNLNDAGLKVVRPEGVDTTLDIVVHDGADRRATVTFYALYEDLEDAKYFWSIKEHKNYAQVAAETYARLYRSRDVTSDLTGLQRRLKYIAADDIKGDYSSVSASDVVSARGQTGLDENKQISLLTAKISQTARPKFKLNYDVGDLVTVFAEFSIAQTMRITEHILSIDKDGSIGYPSLSVVTVI